MSWLRLWHWSRGTPPASSMPSTRFVQSSLITAGTRKKVSSASSCLGQKGVRQQDLVLQAPVAQAEASSSSFEKCSMISVCLAFPPALLLPLCAESWPILGWTDIHSFIRSPNISIEPSAPAPTLSATGDPVTTSSPETLQDIWSPHDDFYALSLINNTLSQLTNYFN